MTRLRRLSRDESGIALVSVVVLMAMITLVSILLIDTVRNEGDRSVRASRGTAAAEAAEAGVEDYIAKMVDNRQYHLQHVHPAESTRRAPDGTTRSAGQTWTSATTWTWPNGRDAWRSLGNGYQYNLQITAPTASTQGVRVVATARKTGSTTEWRSFEALVRPSSVADYFMMTNSDYSAGSGATTYGKIYAGTDGTTNFDLDHDGTAYGNLFAEGQVTGSVTMMNGAQKYDSTTTPGIRTQIKNPISFNNFLNSFADIEAAALDSGIHLDNAAYHGWRLIFASNGTVRVERCTRAGGLHLAEVQPSCVLYNASMPIPANGAIYVEQSAIVSGVVDGRVTVSSNEDVIIPANISYETSGDDVLGLIAQNDVIIAAWCPDDIDYRAAIIAQSGRRRSYYGSESKDTATFTGSVASNLSPYMSMFDERIYNYDNTLAYLPPPWFPVVEEAYSVQLFRELAP